MVIQAVVAFHIKMFQECSYCTKFAVWFPGSSHLQHSRLLAAASGQHPSANQLPPAWRQALVFHSFHYLELQASLSITPLGPTVLPDPLALLPWQRKSQQTLLSRTGVLRNIKDKSLWSIVHAWGLCPRPRCLGHMNNTFLHFIFYELLHWYCMSPNPKTNKLSLKYRFHNKITPSKMCLS